MSATDHFIAGALIFMMCVSIVVGAQGTGQRCPDQKVVSIDHEIEVSIDDGLGAVCFTTIHGISCWPKALLMIENLGE